MAEAVAGMMMKAGEEVTVTSMVMGGQARLNESLLVSDAC